MAYLGNFAPFKEPHIAIEISRKTGIPLKLAGKVNAMGKEYFEKEIEPYLDNSNIEYVGELNDVEKREFLKNSMGVLFPSTWDEPFGSVSSRQNVHFICKHFMNNSHPALTMVLSAHGGVANVVFDKA